MKKIFLTLACVCALVATACADNYLSILQEQLPEKAQTFLSTYFPEMEISLVHKETDVTVLNYDVIFTNGYKVEFDRKGNWTEVDCSTHPVPAGIVPSAITKVVEARYPDAQVTKIERDHREIDVQLSNRVELTFNKNLQLIDID